MFMCEFVCRWIFEPHKTQMDFRFFCFIFKNISSNFVLFWVYDLDFWIWMNNMIIYAIDIISIFRVFLSIWVLDMEFMFQSSSMVLKIFRYGVYASDSTYQDEDEKRREKREKKEKLENRILNSPEKSNLAGEDDRNLLRRKPDIGGNNDLMSKKIKL